MASIACSYNLDDNLTSKTTSGFVGAAANTYAYDQAQRLTSWNNGTTTTGTYNARNQLVTDGTANYTYSARGTLAAKTPTSGTAETYSFDAFDRMITDSAASGAYSYDGLDRVIGHGVGTSAYSGLGNTVASNGQSVYSYSPSDGLVSIGQGSSKTLAYTDRHGDQVGYLHGCRQCPGLVCRL